ncbi:MAG: glycosyltransferase family 2 protein [Pararhodobacter sp.]
MKLAVVIATTGRPQEVGHAVRDLLRQTRLPDRVILSTATPFDVDLQALTGIGLAVEIVMSRKGLTLQRNAALDLLTDESIALFLDDDFVMADDWIEQAVSLFQSNGTIMIATGRVLADGIGGAGLTREEARSVIDTSTSRESGLTEVNNGYGCNMAVRLAPVQRDRIRFDPNLPYYGWLEDVDFSKRLAAYGRCVRVAALRGVHLGVKGGRTSGVKLGYSQIANPIYLMQRSTMRPGHALKMISRNLAANLARSLRPEPWVDRRGRLKGNMLALMDLFKGRLHPQRIISLESGSNA